MNSADLDATTLEFGKEFEGAYPLMLGEVYQLLNSQKVARVTALQTGHATTPGYSTPGSNVTGNTNAMTFTTMNELSEEDLTRTLPKTFLSSFNHAKNFMKISEFGALGDVRERCFEHHLHRFEACQLGNLIVESTDEAKSLIPSITADDNSLRRLLDELKHMKTFVQ